VRWWASLAAAALAASACRGAPPATAGSPTATASAASCKVSQPVCDPTVGDDTALALVRRRCAGCHDDGGQAEHPFVTAAALRAERENVALRLAGCEMPPDDSVLPAAERARLIGWGACAAAAGVGASDREIHGLRARVPSVTVFALAWPRDACAGFAVEREPS
jgi:hypothetical protein